MRTKSCLAAACLAGITLAGVAFAVGPLARQQDPRQPLDWMRPADEVPRWFVTSDRARADNAPGTDLAWKAPVSVTLLARAVEGGVATRYLVRPYHERVAAWVPATALRLGPIKGRDVPAAEVDGKARAILDDLPERVPLFEQ